MKSYRRRRFFFIAPFVVLGFVALFSAIVMLLWNHVLVAVVPVHAVTFWQALGILLLSKILFGGFPGGRRGGGGGPVGHWRRRWAERHWERLTPEQRETMRDEMKRRFGDWPRPPWCGPEETKQETSSPGAAESKSNG